MTNIILFSGTTEGRTISEALSRAKISHTVCVATPMGEEVMAKDDCVNLLTGRMEAAQMAEHMCAGETLAVDATHPYATIVSDNIRKACTMTGAQYLRIRRDVCSQTKQEDGICYYASAEECAEALLHCEGEILLTTGSKDLEVYCEREALRSRIYARVLPAVSSMELCQKAGLDGKHIIGMFGPFSQEMNELMIREFQIRHLVTKESGKAGGFDEKILAAKACGCQIHVITRPKEEEGLSAEEAIRRILELSSGKPENGPGALTIALVGIGTGKPEDLTVAAQQVLAKADVILGAKRMIEAYPDRRTAPFYLAKDVLPYLEELRKDGKDHQVALLFSGDTGMYSGAGAMRQALMEWKGKEEKVTISLYPGISSVSAFASRIGEVYSDTPVLSMHGKRENRKYLSQVYETIRSCMRSFLLLSGWEDLQLLQAELADMAEGLQVTLGYQLGYPEEEIRTFLLSAIPEGLPKGLYIAFLQNRANRKRPFLTLLPDSSFVREKVPMTKAQIRHLSVAKLGLYEGAVVYDIGSGTGSVSCEIAIQSPFLAVYAIERKPEAAVLTRKNAKQLGLSNLTLVEGMAPDVLDTLPAPTHVFIGGSSGNLKQILSCLQQKALLGGHAIRIVINAISLETISELLQVLKEFPCEEEEIVQIQCSTGKKAGSYHLMEAANPVYIADFLLKG